MSVCHIKEMISTFAYPDCALIVTPPPPTHTHTDSTRSPPQSPLKRQASMDNSDADTETDDEELLEHFSNTGTYVPGVCVGVCVRVCVCVGAGVCV